MAETLDRLDKKDIVDKYKAKELAHRTFYYCVISIVILLNIIYIISFHLNSKLTQNLIYETTFILPMSGLAISFYRIRKYFLIYHEDKFQEQKKALWLYFIFDTFGYSLNIF